MGQLRTLFTTARPIAEALLDRLRRLGSGAEAGAGRRVSDRAPAEQGTDPTGCQRSTGNVCKTFIAGMPQGRQYCLRTG